MQMFVYEISLKSSLRKKHYALQQINATFRLSGSKPQSILSVLSRNAELLMMTKIYFLLPGKVLVGSQ